MANKSLTTYRKNHDRLRKKIMANRTICNEQKITSYTSARRKPRTGALKYRVKIFNEYARIKSRIGAQKYWLTIFTEKISRTPAQ